MHPDLAVEEWLGFAAEVGADTIQLSAALHPDEADVPPEAMLDPVANTLDLRAPMDSARANRILAATKETGGESADSATRHGVSITTVGGPRRPERR